MSRYIDADELFMDVIHSYDYCDDFLEMIEQCPTADVRPNVRGEWIVKETDPLEEPTTPFVEYVCDRCGYEPKEMTNFCPHCGALMSESLKLAEIGKAIAEGLNERLNAEIHPSDRISGE